MAQKVLRQFSASKPVSSWQGQRGTHCAVLRLLHTVGAGCSHCDGTVQAVLPWVMPSDVCTSGCCSALAGTSFCSTESSTAARVPQDVAPTIPMAVFPISHIYPPSDLSDQPSKKDVPSELWQKGSSCGSQTEQEELLSHWSCFLSLSEHIQELLMDWSIIQAAKCWSDLLLGTLLSTTGAGALSKELGSQFLFF